MRKRDWFEEYLIELVDSLLWGVKYGLFVVLIVYVISILCKEGLIK